MQIVCLFHTRRSHCRRAACVPRTGSRFTLTNGRNYGESVHVMVTTHAYSVQREMDNVSWPGNSILQSYPLKARAIRLGLHRVLEDSMSLLLAISTSTLSIPMRELDTEMLRHSRPLIKTNLSKLSSV